MGLHPHTNHPPPQLGSHWGTPVPAPPRHPPQTVNRDPKRVSGASKRLWGRSELGTLPTSPALCEAHLASRTRGNTAECFSSSPGAPLGLPDPSPLRRLGLRLQVLSRPGSVPHRCGISGTGLHLSEPQHHREMGGGGWSCGSQGLGWSGVGEEEAGSPSVPQPPAPLP